MLQSGKGSTRVSRPGGWEQSAALTVEAQVNMRTKAAAALFLGLSACATPPQTVGTAAPVARPSRATSAPVRDGVIGLGASQLQAMFGVPVAQLTEGPARKLQFAGTTCVLDAYLYAPASGGEPAVTHVDTRKVSGEDIDRASCVAALRMR